MSDFQQLCAAVDEHPGDTLRWSILADYLEEIGDARSNGLRLLVAEDRRPYYFSATDLLVWSWCGEGEHQAGDCRVSKEVLAKLRNYPNLKIKHDNHLGMWADFDTAHEAILAAAEAYS